MSDAIHDDGPAASSPGAVPRVNARRLFLWCLAWYAGFVVFFIAVAGIGRPETHWYRIGTMQVFESEEGVVAFVEVELRTRRPGRLADPREVGNPVRLYRFDVRRDGSVKKLLLKSPADRFHLLAIDQILKAPDGLFLVEPPSRGQPSYRLHRIEEDRVEPLWAKESDPILRSMGFTDEGEGAAEKITERNGWRLLERLRPPYVFRKAPIVSLRHQLQLRISVNDAKEAIVAESSGEGDRWTVSLLTTNSRRWRSYRSPPRE